jgi:hypothetical protein
MMGFEGAIAELRMYIVNIINLEKERLDVINSPFLPMSRKDDLERDLKSNIERYRQRALNVLMDVLAFPPHHARHDTLLAQFHNTADFENSIFVMTKYPDPKKPDPVDAELEAVIQAARDAVQGCGYVARLAIEKQYHGLLWDNLELYLLGCKRGIAIVEDKYLPELNPNVAMEWGWMRGMGRNVLYLVEKTFRSHRADWSGLIESTFDWANPGPDIKAAVENWLTKRL